MMIRLKIDDRQGALTPMRGNRKEGSRHYIYTYINTSLLPATRNFALLALRFLPISSSVGDCARLNNGFHGPAPSFDATRCSRVRVSEVSDT